MEVCALRTAFVVCMIKNHENEIAIAQPKSKCLVCVLFHLGNSEFGMVSMHTIYNKANVASIYFSI